MRLEIYAVLLGFALFALLVYRRRTIGNAATKSTTPFTAASITMIEAAFLRAGRNGISEVRAAAEQCGVQLADVDATALEAGLAARGLTFDAVTRRTMRRIRLSGFALAIPATIAITIHDAASRAGSRHAPLAAITEFAILWGGTVLAVMALTHLGSSTMLGREALAMRRAAYPLSLLRNADPTATVAHYGGVVRRGKPDATGDGSYVWQADAVNSGHGHDGSSGHGSHSCASTCGSGGCGGH